MHELIYASVMLLFVIGLIFIVAAIFKKFQPGINTGKPKRLIIQESLILDHQNKLMLVARDGVNHLLLINKDHPIVIESDIK